ncbi:MAG: 50S ribosomal protein L20 [Patescibacteria group bacterium]|jgi:large subunit ribosomal protein L20
MTRIKGGKLHAKRRRGILKHTRGYKWGRKSKIKVAKTAKMKAGAYAFAGRRAKKRINRGLWQIRINAAVRQYEISYSRLMGLLKAKKIDLDRKVLSQIAREHPAIFKKIVDSAKA